MASVANQLYDGYQYVFEEAVFPISKGWFMVGKPFNLVLLLAGYLYFCLRLGPWYMSDKKPYNLANVIKIYNIFQILVNLYIFIEATIMVSKFNFRCQDLVDENSPDAMKIAETTWIFYIVKITDLMDTVFFVMRKSNRQITTLHIHHHTMMPIVSWISITYFPGGHAVLVGYINSLVHVFMYTYYLLTSFGSDYKKYVWWKKYLTILQLVQFGILAIHSINSLFYRCTFPEYLKVLVIIYNFLFLNMFGRFYHQNYVKNKSGKKKIK